MASWNSWKSQDRQLIYSIGRAHTGKSPTGSTDTLEALSVSNSYFNNETIRAGQIAAIVRFADELAEGPQRTSNFLIAENKLSKGSKIYHHYAQITGVAVERSRGFVALSYNIETDNPAYAIDGNADQHLKELLALVYLRAAKMNSERRYTRHYADVLLPLRATSISLNFYQSGHLKDINLRPLILNDFSTTDKLDNLIVTVDDTYSIEKVLNSLREAKNE